MKVKTADGSVIELQESNYEKLLQEYKTMKGQLLRSCPNRKHKGIANPFDLVIMQVPEFKNKISNYFQTDMEVFQLHELWQTVNQARMSYIGREAAVDAFFAKTSRTDLTSDYSLDADTEDKGIISFLILNMFFFTRIDTVKLQNFLQEKFKYPITVQYSDLEAQNLDISFRGARVEGFKTFLLKSGAIIQSENFYNIMHVFTIAGYSLLPMRNHFLEFYSTDIRFAGGSQNPESLASLLGETDAYLSAEFGLPKDSLWHTVSSHNSTTNPNSRTISSLIISEHPKTTNREDSPDSFWGKFEREMKNENKIKAYFKRIFQNKTIYVTSLVEKGYVSIAFEDMTNEEMNTLSDELKKIELSFTKNDLKTPYPKNSFEINVPGTVETLANKLENIKKREAEDTKDLSSQIPNCQ